MSVGLLPRAFAAFLILPGTVAFLVPWLLRPPGSPFRAEGVVLLAPGLALLLACVAEFYRAAGTLAPWSPPERLVTTGPYRASRNPMYVAVLLVIGGWALAWRTTPIGVYALVVAIAFHVRVVAFEEPFQARTWGGEWSAYRASVPRWIGRVRPATTTPSSRPTPPPA